MGSLPIVKSEIFSQADDGFGRVLIIAQVTLFVFDAAPEPFVEFDFELADLLMEIRFESLFFLGVAFAPGREGIRQTLDGLFFPLRRHIWMNAVVSSDLIDRPLTFDRFQGDLHLECCGVRFWLLLLNNASQIGSDFTP
jgi:hypothetical protein